MCIYLAARKKGESKRKENILYFRFFDIYIYIISYHVINNDNNKAS